MKGIFFIGFSVLPLLDEKYPNKMAMQNGF